MLTTLTKPQLVRLLESKCQDDAHFEAQARTTLNTQNQATQNALDDWFLSVNSYEQLQPEILSLESDLKELEARNQPKHLVYSQTVEKLRELDLASSWLSEEVLCCETLNRELEAQISRANQSNQELY